MNSFCRIGGFGSHYYLDIDDDDAAAVGSICRILGSPEQIFCFFTPYQAELTECSKHCFRSPNRLSFAFYIMSKTAKLSWLEKNFAFYASYHNDPINQLIHIVCVWPILWTAILFLAYTDPIPGLDAITSMLPGNQVCNFAVVGTAIYFIYYLLIELPGIAGPIASAMIVLCYYSAMYVKETYAEQQPWKLGIVVHVGCWVAQFYGHGVHEGRSPALLDNLFQAIMMAPLFVLMEVLFKLGYKPKFHAKVQGIVDENIRQFKKKT